MQFGELVSVYFVCQCVGDTQTHEGRLKLLIGVIVHRKSSCQGSAAVQSVCVYVCVCVLLSIVKLCRKFVIR